MLSPGEGELLAAGNARLSRRSVELDSVLAGLDAECRIMLGRISEELAGRVLDELQAAAGRKKIRNPSGFLVRLVTTALSDDVAALQEEKKQMQAETRDQPAPPSPVGGAPAEEEEEPLPLPLTPAPMPRRMTEEELGAHQESYIKRSQHMSMEAGEMDKENMPLTAVSFGGSGIYAGMRPK